MKHLGSIILAAVLLVVAIPATGLAKTIPASSPPLAAHAATPEKFVPVGWRLWEIRKGDLNKDGVSDAVLIMQRGDNERAYRLAVVFGNSAGGFDLAAENGEIMNGDQASYPNSDGFQIRRGAFTVQMERVGGGVADITFTFRYQDGRFVLIGYDYLGSHRGWVKLSFNMLTGQVVQTEGDIYAGNEVVVDWRGEGKFAPAKPIALDDLGYSFDFDDSFDPFKYKLRQPR